MIDWIPKMFKEIERKEIRSLFDLECEIEIEIIYRFTDLEHDSSISTYLWSTEFDDCKSQELWLFVGRKLRPNRFFPSWTPLTNGPDLILGQHNIYNNTYCIKIMPPKFLCPGPWSNSPIYWVGPYTSCLLFHFKKYNFLRSFFGKKKGFLNLGKKKGFLNKRPK